MSWVSRLLALLLLLPVSASGQSNPGFVQNQVLTANQLNTAFSNKTDFPIPSINLATGVTGTLGVPNGGTGVNIFTLGKPVVGNGTNPLSSGATTGNTTTFVTNTGTNTSGHCLQWDANGNAVDSGSACGTGGGGAVSSVFGRTGVVVSSTGDYNFSQIGSSATFSQLPTLSADNLAGNPTAGTTVMTGVPLLNCSGGANALNYSTTTHTFTCNVISGGSATSITVGTTTVGSGTANNILTTGGAGNLLSQISQVTFAMLPNVAADNVIGNPTGSTAAPTNLPLVNCSGGNNALNYNTTTHVFSCNTIPASNPGGVSGQIQFNNAGSFGGFTMSQDCTITTGGVITCTKTNNVAFANSATIDTTNASNISSGTLAQARLPASSTQTIQSGTAVLGTSAIASATCATAITVGATGVATTDVVSASFNGDPTAVTGYIPSTNGMLTIIPYPTANNVNFKVCNNTSGSITPGAVTLNWRVVR